MIDSDEYLGIRFPDRAESLNDFQGYKTFLGPWEPLAKDLRAFYEGLALRRETRVLAVHGDQGIGKTMFATQLKADFQRTKTGGLVPDPDNLWQRVVGGADLSPGQIDDATTKSDLLVIEDDPKWVETAASWVAGRTDRRLVIIADNAERAYFRQGLVAMSDTEFVNLMDNPGLTSMAAQRLVAACRNALRGCLLVVLSNDQDFLLGLDSAVEKQHVGLLTLTSLPVPDAQTKETVVRVNTNRLNGVSYWYCLDKAGPEEKRNVMNALEGASTFPDSFAAVNAAIQSADASRMGRPARKNLISLLTLTSLPDVSSTPASDLGEVQRVEVASELAHLAVYSKGWAPSELGGREGRLLQSEWAFRSCVVSDRVVSSIVSVGAGDDPEGRHLAACQRLIALLSTFHGPGTHDATRKAYTESWEELSASWPSGENSTVEFWNGGQQRSGVYEAAMRTISPGYDTSSEGFMSYRPDIVVNPFRPCSIVSAISDDQPAINSAIRREAQVIELTAMSAFSMSKVRSYMASKFNNYVLITQEQ